MNKRKILENLGYRTTDESGAIMEHPDFIWEDKFVWEDESIFNTLQHHNGKLERSIKEKLIQTIRENKII